LCFTYPGCLCLETFSTIHNAGIVKCFMFQFQSGSTIQQILLKFKSRVKEVIKNTYSMLQTVSVTETAPFYWPMFQKETVIAERDIVCCKSSSFLLGGNAYF